MELRRGTAEGLHRGGNYRDVLCTVLYSRRSARWCAGSSAGDCEVDGPVPNRGWRVRKDGEKFWALVVIDAIYAESGDLIGFAKITRDITERQRAQQELIESERRYRSLVEAVMDYAIFQLDPSGFVTTWNPGAERIKGYTSSEIIGQHFSKFYTEEDRTKGLPSLALNKASNEGRFEAESQRVRKDGSRF